MHLKLISPLNNFTELGEFTKDISEPNFPLFQESNE